jgi:antitoxin component of RelBE/YafQ-DinJ toxin-antitoxin module
VKMKQKIVDILEETGYKESRAAKMDLNDILKYVCLPLSLVFANVNLVDYCRPFMTLTFISLECAPTIF